MRMHLFVNNLYPLIQESGEATRQEEDRDIAARMTESFLEQQQKQQQVLATQALLNSLTTQTNHHPLLPYSPLHSDSESFDTLCSFEVAILVKCVEICNTCHYSRNLKQAKKWRGYLC